MSSRPYTPRDHQPLITRHVLEIDRGNTWSGMGTGKTVAVLTALDMLELLGELDPTLIIAPLRVAHSVWPVEVKKWDHLAHHDVVPVLGNIDARKAALQQLRRGKRLFTINYDNLPWLVDLLNGEWPFRNVVADESTRLKSFRLRKGSKRAKKLAQHAHKDVRRFINLTGTPAPNGLKDLWGQAWFLDAGQRLGRTYTAFEDRWFEANRIPNSHFFKREPRDYAQEQIEGALQDLTVTFTNPMGVDKPIVNVITVDLPTAAMRAYKSMEKELFAQIADHEIEAMNAAAKSMKCLQIANGAAYTDESGAWVEIHKAKLEALDSVIEEAAGMPVLVAYHFKSDLARLKAAFPQGRELDARPQTIVDWNAGKIPVLFAHPASAGHGLNLQDGSNILAFFGLWWDLELHDQIIERIGPARQKQSGHNRSVFLHYICAKGTIDFTVLRRLETKRSVQDLLLEAMKGGSLG